MVWYPDEEIVLETHRIMIEKYGGRLGFERGIEAFKHILADVKVAKGIYRKATILLRRLVTGRIFKDGNHNLMFTSENKNDGILWPRLVKGYESFIKEWLLLKTS